MPRLAMLFPGQGAQSVGMLAERSPIVARTYAEAGQALGYDLAGLIRDGPAEQLDQTEYTQPALVAAGVALWRVWQESGGAQPAMLAGHSLGEYTALVAAGALDFGDALRVTRLRGQAMQAAVAPGQGAMCAIIGLDDEAVDAVCARATDEHAADRLVVSPANFNAPGQVVVAGHVEAVDTAARLAKADGAKRAKILAVSVPAHCALMQDVAVRLRAALDELELAPPRLPVLHNVDARPRDGVDAIRDALVGQLTGAVRWHQTIGEMRRAGCDMLCECGPGRVLTGLNKRIDKKIRALAFADPQGMEDALHATAAGP